ncbi:transposase [Ureibacillus sp. FSL K6-2830]|uniref:transposase n=1 Tax=Ureibacillus sp. FSL K6-2830 TaxID=2954610 RepID=UPI00404745F9
MSHHHSLRKKDKTINKSINDVENTLKYDYHNGILEGIHNKIKVMKRISFGYRSFYHFRNRILSENKNSLGEPRISPKPSDYLLPNNITKIYSPTPFDKEPIILLHCYIYLGFHLM